MSRLLGLTLALLLTANCSDDTGGNTDSGGTRDAGADSLVRPDSGGDSAVCQLSIASINGQPASDIQQIDSTLDQDGATTGIQLDIQVSVLGAPDGTTITLDVTNLAPSPTAQASAGRASFTAVTVDPAQTTVATFTPVAAGCGATPESFNTQADPTCAFVTPTDQAVLHTKDDKIPGNNSFDFDVVVTSENSVGGQVTLKVENTQVDQVAPDQAGVAQFPSTVLPSTPTKKVTLEAEVEVGQLKGNCQVVVTVDVTAPTCVLGAFVPAAINTSKGDGLGPAQDADPQTAGLQTAVTVSSLADEVLLKLNGAAVGAAVQPQAGTATFNLDMPEGTNTLEATCTDTTTGNIGQSQSSQVLVDTAVPAAVNDLACTVTHNRKGEITCTFTAPADPSPGSGIESCALHYRTNDDIDDTNFDAADTTKKALAVAAGAQNTLITGLAIPNSYDFALKCQDVLGNTNDISSPIDPANVVFLTSQITGTNADALLGSPLVSGDFNCDGLTDIAVGRITHNSNAGEVQLFFSDGTGFPATFSTKIAGTRAGALFGITITALNFDGDANGCDDLAVSAMGASSDDDKGIGRLYLFLGGQTWLERSDEGTGNTAPAEVRYQLPAGAAAGDILYSVGALDLDGDGKGDLATAFWAANGTGSVLVDYGDTNVTPATIGSSPAARLMPASADMQVTGGLGFQDWFGAWPTNGGDLDGDGKEDLLISAYQHKVGGTPRGAVHVLLGAAKGATQPEPPIDIGSSARITSIIGGSENEYFGQTLAGVGDLNGDGTAEFVVSDIGVDGANADIGKLYIFNLSGTPPTSPADAKAVVVNDLQGATSTSWLGWSLANGARIHPIKGGDINNDQVADLLVGMRRTGATHVGSAYAFYGKIGALTNLSATGADQVLKLSTGATVNYSKQAAFVGDVNGDGYSDFVVTDTYFDSKKGLITVYR